jgi:hypothetical protein
LPQADALALIDADGKRINASRRRAVSGADFSDHDFIAYFRLHDEPTSFLGMPVKSRTNSGWTIVVARRISGPGGEFLGTIVATIRTDYLEEFYKAITLPELGPVTVLRRDGTIFARYPRLEENIIGQKMPAGSPWLYWPKAVAFFVPRRMPPGSPPGSPGSNRCIRWRIIRWLSM